MNLLISFFIVTAAYCILLIVFKPEVKNFRKKVYTACELGDTELLRVCLEDSSSFTSEEVVEALNQITQDGLTLLQLASQHGYKDIVW